MSAAARPKIALCSPAARPEAALLERHGYRVTASATATADVVMPARGGALAFVLHRAEAAWSDLLRATDGLLDAHLVQGVLSWVYAPAAERAPAAAPREREREREAKVPRLGPPPMV